MSVAFPTLSRGVSVRGFNEELAFDPSIRAQAEDGQVISRRRFTGEKESWDFSYEFLTANDKSLLDTMQSDAGVGADTITGWTHPISGVSYTVRLLEPIKYHGESEDHDKYGARLRLEQA